MTELEGLLVRDSAARRSFLRRMTVGRGREQLLYACPHNLTWS